MALIPEMIKAVLERGMQAELTDHLGYEEGAPAGRGSGNSRNVYDPEQMKQAGLAYHAIGRAASR